VRGVVRLGLPHEQVIYLSSHRGLTVKSTSEVREYVSAHFSFHRDTHTFRCIYTPSVKGVRQPIARLRVAIVLARERLTRWRPLRPHSAIGTPPPWHQRTWRRLRRPWVQTAPTNRTPVAGELLFRKGSSASPSSALALSSATRHAVRPCVQYRRSPSSRKDALVE
jgi:hypothetical protein